MDLQPVIVSVVSLAFGAGLTLLTTWINSKAAHKREDEREARADEKRKAAAGREHAKVALSIVKAARAESWKRSPEKGSMDLELEDLRLDVAAAEIDLIPDPLLRPRLASVLSAVRYPWTLANSSHTQGYPVETQREGLWLLGQALAAYVREEPTPTEPDRLAELAKANDDAHEEREEWEAERLAEERSERAARRTPSEDA